jgi:hypothetical protein
MVSRAFETRDGKILVVASDEGHISYMGHPLSGGILEWDGAGFKKVPSNRHLPTYITSYTITDSDRAIVGTDGHFFYDGADGFRDFSKSGDVTYGELSKRLQSVYLGTRGAKFDDDIWLFGTTSGVVGYRSGEWFFPERLNWLLPDQKLAPYGSRVVHAVATDKHNRVYVGTDRGLLIDDSDGENAVEFLVLNNARQLALEHMEEKKLKHEADALLPSLPPNTTQGRLYEQYKSSKDSLEDLQKKLATASLAKSSVPSKLDGTDTKTSPPTTNSNEDLRDELARREKAHRVLLSQIEQQSYALYQMLELKPLDLVALSKSIPPNDAVVQYLPLKDSLLIDVVTRGHTEIRKVNVASDELFKKAADTSGALARLSLRTTLKSSDAGLGESESKAAVDDSLLSELHWLYQQLIAPVEDDIKDMRHVYIVPVGSLTYLPFATLVRDLSHEKVEYAVSRFNIGSLPTMYLLDLVLRLQDPPGQFTALFGDPD